MTRRESRDIIMKHGAAIGRAIAERIEPCPWNPFPLDSEWGRKIEEQYRLDKIGARRGGRKPRHVRTMQALDGIILTSEDTMTMIERATRNPDPPTPANLRGAAMLRRLYGRALP